MPLISLLHLKTIAETQIYFKVQYYGSTYLFGMRSEAQLPSELTLWFGPYTVIYTGGNAAYSNSLARVAHPLASGWSGVEWAEEPSRRRSAGAASGSDHQARLPCDTGASCLLHGTGVVLP